MTQTRIEQLNKTGEENGTISFSDIKIRLVYKLSKDYVQKKL